MFCVITPTLSFIIIIIIILFVTQQPSSGLGRLVLEVSISLSLSLTHTHTHKYILIHSHMPGITPLNEWSARRIGRYLHNIQWKQATNIHAPSVLKPAIPAIERFQTYALDRRATGIGYYYYLLLFSLPRTELDNCTFIFKGGRCEKESILYPRAWSDFGIGIRHWPVHSK